MVYTKLILIKLKLVKLSENNILKWKENNQVEKVEYALVNGNFKSRKAAAEALGELGYHSSVPLLFNAINDKIQAVSISALNALEQIGCDDEIGSLVIRKRFNWLEKLREIEARNMASKTQKRKIYRWNRSSKKSFDLLKQQLNKPIR